MPVWRPWLLEYQPGRPGHSPVPAPAGPADQVAYTRDVIAAARAGGRDEGRAVRRVARSLGRGAAALVNALDPAMVTVGGLGPDLLDFAGGTASAAYHDGLMAFRRAEPPPLVPARFGAEGPLTGAAEEGFSAILASDAAGQWAARQHPLAGIRLRNGPGR